MSRFSFVLIAIISCFFLKPSAETHAQERSVLGVKVGFQSSGVYTDPEIIGRENGMSGFLFWDVPFSEWVALEQNIGVIQRGFRNTQTLIDDEGFFVADITARTRTAYVSYNPMLSLERYTPDYAKVFLAFGPRVEYLIQNRKGVFSMPDDTEITDAVADNLDSWLWGLAVTTGLKKVELGEGELRFSVGYQFDISDSLSAFSQRSARNNALIFTFGIGL